MNIFEHILEQGEELVEAHFLPEPKKSEARENWEKKAGHLKRQFRKVLILVVYILLVTIIMRLVMISTLAPYQFGYEMGSIHAERDTKEKFDRYKNWQMNDTLTKLFNYAQEWKRRAFDSIDLGHLPSVKEFTRKLDPAFNWDTLQALELRTKFNKNGFLNIGKNDSITLYHAYMAGYEHQNYFYDYSGDSLRLSISDMGYNSTRSFSILKHIYYEGTSIGQTLLLLFILLVVLWIMKWIIRIFYIINNAINPFSIDGTLGNIALVSLLLSAVLHLFAISVFFELLKQAWGSLY